MEKQTKIFLAGVGLLFFYFYFNPQILDTPNPPSVSVNPLTTNFETLEKDIATMDEIKKKEVVSALDSTFEEKCIKSRGIECTPFFSYAYLDTKKILGSSVENKDRDIAIDLLASYHTSAYATVNRKGLRNYVDSALENGPELFFMLIAMNNLGIITQEQKEYWSTKIIETDLYSERKNLYATDLRYFAIKSLLKINNATSLGEAMAYYPLVEESNICEKINFSLEDASIYGPCLFFKYIQTKKQCGLNFSEKDRELEGLVLSSNNSYSYYGFWENKSKEMVDSCRELIFSSHSPPEDTSKI